MLILATKLHIPPPRPKRVFRDDLVDKLDKGMHGKLTLISAPAGFGKSTLLSHWVETCERSVAWLSLDDKDNDQIRFLAYLVAAFQTISPDFGMKVMQSFNSPEPFQVETILTLLLNEITSLNKKMVLILDDYHLIKAVSIDAILIFLIDHLPPQLHVVIAAREHPKFPLARLRSQDQLTELLASELRFTSGQITEFLNQVIGLNLMAQDIDILEKRTEGWIAGLQLAALALQGAAKKGQQDTTNFIKSFTGHHHFVIDYLVEEVLHHQSEEVVAFLHHTSILNRFCAPLCDAILLTPSGSSQAILDYLERANLLFVPLDNSRHWYRYHHLFADALRARLEKEQPNRIANLHVQASIWYEQNHFGADAIHHALAAKDFERAADLIEQDWAENSGTSFGSETWLGWIKTLPNELVQNRPQLTLGFIWELLFLGELEAAQTRVNQLDHMLALAAETDKTSTKGATVDDKEYRSLRSSLALAQAFYAQTHDNINDTIKHTRQALAFVSETDYLTQGLANSLLGLAFLTRGDLKNAYQTTKVAKADLQQAGNLLYATTVTFTLANIRIAQGRLREAIVIYEQALQRLEKQQQGNLPGTADLHLGLCELHHQLGEDETAVWHLEKSKTLGKPAALSEWPYPLYLAQARIKHSHGDLDGALELLNLAEGLYQPSPVPNLRPVAAAKAQLWLQQGKIVEALNWSQIHKLSVADELDYLHEFEHITLARVLVAHYRKDGVTQSIDDALALLERLRKAAEQGGRGGSVIEIMTLQTLAYQAQGNIALALQSLAETLSLAEPERYVRLFIDEGLPMAELLHAAKLKGIRPAYTTRLLTLSASKIEQRLDKSDISTQTPVSSTIATVDPLSTRELEILSLIAVGKKNQEIADQLIISLNTVRYHTKNLYRKLGVNKRTQAVAKAQAQGLI